MQKLEILKKIKITIIFISVTFIILIFIIPLFSYKVGEIFFGKVKPFYNVTLAQFFFINSTKPILYQPVPRNSHYQVSRTYFIQGRLDKALIEIKEELKIYPDNTSAYYVLGLTLGYLNRNHEAIDAFTKYIESHQETWAGRNDKAWLQFRVGDIDGAIETIEPVVNNFKLTPWVQNTYCALLISKEKYKEALEPCTNAKNAVQRMTADDWGHAYPGNDPRIYSDGLVAMKISIDSNLDLISKNIKK